MKSFEYNALTTKSSWLISCAICFIMAMMNHAFLLAQALDFKAVHAEVHFDKKLRPWDGFGFNYVETAQTMDYDKDPQEYGGFSLLNEKQKQEIIEMIFGEDGLKVGLVKMFYDPWHQKEPGGKFDHERSTAHMRYFVREGLKKTRTRGANLEIITTLYGPPAWATQQKFIRGRDIDPAMKEPLADYMVSWIKFLREKEGFPVKYISLHNEGEDWERWPTDGSHGNIGTGHDYNMFWSPQLVNEFILLMRDKMDKQGLGMVGVTNGEPTNWFRFSSWGYADALYDHEEVLEKLGLLTSHGFYVGAYNNRWFGPHTSEGVDMLREKRPLLKAWVTSTSWSAMDTKFAKEMHGNIYTSKVNGIIPWAGIQRPPLWVGGDPNPGSAFTIHENGTYTVRPGYYMYKQLSRAGQPGMAVARTISMDSQIALIAFASDNSEHKDAFIIINWSNDNKKVAVSVHGTGHTKFDTFISTEGDRDPQGKLTGNGDKYKALGKTEVKDNVLIFDAPKGSVTTFFGTN
ncbi:MAG: hypothetical protein JJU28_19965 [Cyclobacteriaceae bacterium]|nr:hypothetical protein [Cyclobacteriaceae bacterium]